MSKSKKNKLLFILPILISGALLFSIIQVDAIQNGQIASIVLGKSVFTSGSIPGCTASTTFSPDNAILDSSGNLWVADTSHSRILKFDSPFSNGDAATLVLGQPDFVSCSANQGGAIAADTLNFPNDLEFDSSGNLWVVDASNDRVVMYPTPFSNGMSATRVIGQPDLVTLNVNNLFFEATSIDMNSTDDLFVADFQGRKIYVFEDPFTGAAASGIVGSTTGTTANQFAGPTGVEIDPSGNMWVSDRDNHRVLKFTSPILGGDSATLVLGQDGFFAGTANRGNPVNASSLDQPYKLAFGSSGNLLVADRNNNRVLQFNAPIHADDDAADLVLGQPDFVSNADNQGGSVASNTLFRPEGMSFGSPDVWVADSNNQRLLKFLDDNSPPSTPTGLTIIGGTPTSDSTPSLDWDDSVDAGVGLPATDAYSIIIDDDVGLGTPAVSGTSSTSDFTVPGGTPLTDGTWYWLVTVEDAIGNSINSGIETFDVDTIPPTFEIQYFSDSGFTTSLGDNPSLKAGTYYLRITSNEALTGNPVITIDAEGIANDVGALGTTSVGGNVYSFTRTIVFDAAAVGTTIEDVSITIGDIAGNVATDANPTNEGTKAAYTDTVSPTVTTTVSDLLISEADAGGTFTVTATFDEAMDQSIPNIPVVTFTGPAIGSTLTLNAGLSMWTSTTVYTTVYDVADDDIMVTGVGAVVSGAKDVATNNQNTDVSGATFDVDTEMPSVGAATVETSTSDNIITDADVAVGGFTVTATFDEAMDQTAPNTPVVTFAPLVGSTLTLNAGLSMWTSTTVYTTVYDVADAGVEVASITATVSGAKDLAGNMQKPDTSAPGVNNPFAIDTKNPTVTTTVSDLLISEADVGAGNFEVTATFDEAMDQSIPNIPVVTFTGPAIGLTLTLDGGSSTWLSPTVYEAVYDVADDDIMVTGVGAVVSGAKDVALNDQDVDISGATFDVDTEMPEVDGAAVLSVSTNAADMTTPGTIADLDEGDTFTVTVVYDEPMDSSGANDPTILFSPDIETSLTLNYASGVWSTTTLTDDTYTESYTIGNVGEDHDSVDISSIAGAHDSPAGNTQVEYTAGIDATEGPFGVDTLNPTIAELASLTIFSNNNFDLGATAATQVATAGNEITVTLHASETLDSTNFVQADDVTIAGVGDSDGDLLRTIVGDTITGVLTVDTDDTQGVTTFVVKFRDVYGNEADADDLSSFNIEEDATNAHITDGSQVVLDYTAPPSRLVVIQSGDDITTDPQFTYERVAQDIALTCDDDFDTVIAVAGCLETKITGDIVGTGGNESIMPTETRDFTPERGNKAITVEFFDRAGNSATTDDDINLDSIITAFSLTEPAPTPEGEWEDTVFKVEGVVENPLITGTPDQALVDFKYRLDFSPTFDFQDGYEHPSPAQCVTLTPDGTDPNGDRYLFEATTEYPRPTQDTTDSNPDHTHIPEASLVLGDCIEAVDFASTVFTPVTETSVTSGPGGNTDVDKASTNTQNTLERNTTVNVNIIPDTFINNRFYVTGGSSTGFSGLIEEIDNTGIPLKLIEFEGSGAPEGVGTFEDLNDVVSHEGVTITDNDEVLSGTDGILRLKPSTDGSGAGATILTPHHPGFVSLTIDDSGDNRYELLITNSVSDTFTDDIVSQSSGPIQVTISDSNGIAKIELIAIFAETDPPVLSPTPLVGETLGITKIETRGFELEKINQLDFTSTGGDETYLSKTFDSGLFFSEGTAQNTKANNLIVNAKFTDSSDPDYLPSDDSLPPLPLPNEKTYSVFTSSLSGFSNTGTATVKLDFGTGFTAQLCEYDPGDLNGNGIEDDDVDRDAVCDSWETSGIPYKFGGPSFFFPINEPCPTCTGVDITTPAGNIANILDEEAVLTGTQNSNDLTPVVGKRDYYLEIDAMDLHPADVKAINDVIILWADLGPGPAVPHNAIDGVTYPVQPANNDGVALHVFLDQGRLQPSFVDSNSNTVFDSGEPLYVDQVGAGPGIVSFGDTRLLNTGSLTGKVTTGDSDINTPLLPVVGIPSDGLEHKSFISVWRDQNKKFDDDFNTIKAENYGTRDLINPFISKSPSYQIKAVDASLGQYELIIDNLELSTPFDSRAFDKSKGQITQKILIPKSSSDSITGNTITMGTTDGGVTTYNAKVTANIPIPGDKQLILVKVSYITTSKLTDKLLDTATVPFTMVDPLQAPLGCTPSSAAGTFCNDAENTGEFPQVTGQKKNSYAQVYRYSERVHSFGGPSGEAELRGNDIVEALGVGFGKGLTKHSDGTRHQKAGTLAHELLHTVNFLHGGPQYLISDPTQTTLSDTAKNCKPYPGVDKYTRQLPNIYLDLALSDPDDDRSDVLPSSEWQLEYSDGTHGINLQEATIEPAHFTSLVLAGTTVGGLDESALVEDLTSGLSGTPYTMVFATPNSDHGHTYHKHLSDASGTTGTDFNQPLQNGDIDWNDSQTIEAGSVSSDINNFGISGCVAANDAEYYDYDTGYHMDMNFRQGPSGQFDGITSFANDATGNDLWRSVSSTATFDGLDPEEVQSGEEVVIAGTVHQIIIQLQALQESEGTPADPLFLEGVALAQVWVSQDPLATIEGTDPSSEWVPVTDFNPLTEDENGDPLTPAEIEANSKFMRWDDTTESLIMDWDTPNRNFEANLPNNDDINGGWYIRVVLVDNPISSEEGVISCDVNIEELITNPLTQTACLFGDEGDPDSNFLIDPIVPHMDDDGEGNDPGDADEQLKATGKVILKLPKPIKTEDFITTLESIQDDAVSGTAKIWLGWAIDDLEDSLNNDWWEDTVILDARHGHKVLSNEAETVDVLERLVDGNWPFNGESQDLRDRAFELSEDLATVDRILAEAAVYDADNFVSTNSDWYEYWKGVYEQELLDAQAHFDNDNFDNAIWDYEDAWQAAFRAMFNEADDDGIEGTANNNNIFGSNFNNDDLSGLAGNDYINALGDDDELFGGAGKDFLYGGWDVDYINGGDDRDVMYGGVDIDWLVGGKGKDIMYGQSGNDFLYGNEERDRIYGSWGDDLIFGGSGNDRLLGQSDDDKIFGEDGNDEVYGSYGNDFLDGGPGNDYISGWKGKDILISGPGTDTLYGGQSDDVLVGSGEGDYLHCASGNVNDYAFYGPTDIVKDNCEIQIPLSLLTIAASATEPVPVPTADGEYWLDPTTKSLSISSGGTWTVVFSL